MQNKVSNVIRPLEYWQVVEMATARQLSEMRAAEIRRRIGRSIDQLDSLKVSR